MRKGIRLFFKELIYNQKEKGIVMKTILALVAALTLGTAYAQTTTDSGSGTGGMGGMMNVEGQGAKAMKGQRHMIEFQADSVPRLIYSLERTKNKGTKGDNESGSELSFNYAYAIHPNIQVGAKFNFFNGVFANNDVERMDLSVGGWFNFLGGDLANSAYVSLLLGSGYAHTFGANGGRDDLRLTTAAIGKRFSMGERWGLNHLSWTPEIALVNENSTTDTSFDYRQATEFRILQFSVLW